MSYFTKSHLRVAVLLSCNSLDQSFLSRSIQKPSLLDLGSASKLGSVLLTSTTGNPWTRSYFSPFSLSFAVLRTSCRWLAVVPRCLLLLATFHHCCLWH